MVVLLCKCVLLEQCMLHKICTYLDHPDSTFFCYPYDSIVLAYKIVEGTGLGGVQVVNIFYHENP
eukprot:SAG31_NODE_4548_length_3149_cov_1.504918_6_plen_65_part_00